MIEAGPAVMADGIEDCGIGTRAGRCAAQKVDRAVVAKPHHRLRRARRQTLGGRGGGKIAGIRAARKKDFSRRALSLFPENQDMAIGPQQRRGIIISRRIVAPGNTLHL